MFTQAISRADDHTVLRYVEIFLISFQQTRDQSDLEQTYCPPSPQILYFLHYLFYLFVTVLFVCFLNKNKVIMTESCD